MLNKNKPTDDFVTDNNDCMNNNDDNFYKLKFKI